ncbi:MAG: outer membrane protein assembly factor BamD [Thermodesulfovibrionales bacterium]|nr:outer membrane protein assembly factor BamD [Thermodesulfovibrionales bacterium]
MISKHLITVLFILTISLLFACGKEVKKETPYNPEVYISRADKLINDKDYEEARKLLFEVKNRDQTRQYAQIAQLKIADSYIRDGDYDLGIEEYRKFIEHFPDSQYAMDAQYQIAMAYFNQIEGPDKGAAAATKALNEFKKLKEQYPRNPYREIVDIRIEKCINVIADYEFIVGQFYFKKESYKAALGRFENLLKRFPDYKKADETLYYIGLSYKGLKDTEKAKSIFKELIDKYPKSNLIQKAKKEI